MRGIEVIPSAKRFINSLRNMGYNFSQAVADLVDNSIEADATQVAIDIEFDGDDSWVRIADNGRGMKPKELQEAMRYGSERDYDSNDLGRFGLGLKTASMSQCRRLSVASRSNPTRMGVVAYLWDLDHVERTNRWEILPIERNGLGPTIRQPLKDSTGTVVLWQRLDRILDDHEHPYGEAARKRLSQECRELELYLGMIFHRFLTGEVRGKRLKLRLNGNDIRPWDPFCRTETKTRRLQPIPIAVQHEKKSCEVLLEPYILPHQDDFSSPAAFRDASGLAGWNQQQGFYIYRAGRMIQSGGWSSLHARDEHLKLARVALSFPPSLDEVFKINVAKMSVQLPAQIRYMVQNAIVPVRKLAREVYDRKPGRSKVPKPSPPSVSSHSDPAPTTSSAPRNTAAETPTSDGIDPVRLLSIEEWSERLLAAANDHERPVVESVLSRLRKQLEG